MAVKRTLLEMTQSLLAAMDSGEVNSIGDTVESYDIALLLRDVYYDIAVELELTSHETLFELQASGDPLKPTLMTLPDNVNSLAWIKYNNILSTETVSNYVSCHFKKFEDFMKMQTSIRENSATGEMTISLNEVSEDFEFIYATDKMPQWYTHIGNDTILFDSYDSAEDTTLQKSKTLCGGVVYPTFTLTDTFIADLDASQFPYYFQRAKVRAFTEKKQVDNREAASEARNQKNLIQKNKDKVSEGTALQKMSLGRYGRR